MELDFSTIMDPEGVLGAEIQTNGVRMLYDLLPPDNVNVPAGVDRALRNHVIRPSIGFMIVCRSMQMSWRITTRITTGWKPSLSQTVTVFSILRFG